MSIHLLTDYASIFIGLQVYLLMRHQSNVPKNHLYAYVMSALIGALIGSRLLAVLNDPTLFFSSHAYLLMLLGNKTIIGGIAGGIVGIEIAKKILGIRQKTGDSAVVPLIIAIIVGRIGCQVAGVSDGTIGVPCDWAWCFPQGDAFNRHPLPLYEIGALLIALPFAYRIFTRRLLPEGMLFRLFIIGYFGLRFFLEFLKERHDTVFLLSAIQIVCLVTCTFYLYDAARNLSSREDK